MLAYFFADVDILLLDAEGFIAEQAMNFGDGFARGIFDDGFHAVQRPREVDGGRTGGVEVVGCRVEATRKFVVVVGVDLECGEVDADGSGIADGGRTAHLEFTDCRPDFALRFEMQVFGTIREFGLVDDDEGTLLFVEGEGFHVEDVGAHAMPLSVENTDGSIDVSVLAKICALWQVIFTFG